MDYATGDYLSLALWCDWTRHSDAPKGVGMKACHAHQFVSIGPFGAFLFNEANAS